MFADHARIIVKSGKGGDGHVSFRKEKFVPAGGPDGGDGGNGGSIVFVVDPGANTLADFRNVHRYCAENGVEGAKKKCKGKSGEDLRIKVPEGTVIRDVQTGKVIIDMSGDTKEYCLLKGGLGGNGNQHYATSTMQAPRYAQPGQPAREMELAMELKGDYTIVIVTHNMQQATRISDKTAFFLLGEVVEFNDTDTLFSMPKDKRTEDYITGRFG